jgi:hypothetical protein
MSEIRNRMIPEMQLAGLDEGTRREYLWAVRQLAVFYMVSPDHLGERLGTSNLARVGGPYSIVCVATAFS